jgi:hypothetical protein
LALLYVPRLQNAIESATGGGVDLLRNFTQRDRGQGAENARRAKRSPIIWWVTASG